MIVEKDMYKTLLDGLFEGVYFVDRERRITYWNSAAERITGYSGDAVIGHGCREGTLCHVDDAGNHLCESGCPLAATMADGQSRIAHVYVHHAAGHRVPVRVASSPILDESKEIIGAVESFVEDSEWRDTSEHAIELEKLAFIDALTGLPNRRHLDHQLESRLDELSRYGWPCGVLLIDIDHFKRINDTHGHDVGDAVLKMVARSLEAGVRSSDVVGRWGGEEFLIIVANAPKDVIAAVAERTRMLVGASVLCDPVEISVTISVGAVGARKGETAVDVVRRADENLYRVKQSGRNAVCFE